VTTRTAAYGAGAVAAVGYAWFVAGTTPFTTGADVLTAVPLVVVVVVAVVQQRRPRWLRLPADDPPMAGSWLPWVAVVVVVVAWEVFCELAGPRSAHPTLSSIEVAVTRGRAAKAAVVAAWLALGAYLVRR
jgi:hypothetical protein